MTSNQPGGKRLLKSKSGLKMVFQHDRETAPWDLAEPPWVPDEETAYCSACHLKFDFLRRKHHCRRCGKIFCAKCCSARVQLHRMGFVDPVRHCVTCSATTQSEADFFDNQIKVLFNGAAFHVSNESGAASTPSSGDTSFGSGISNPSTSSKDGPRLYYLKLSSDQRSLVFDLYESSAENGSVRSGAEPSSIQPIDMSKVLMTEVHQEGGDKKDEVNAISLHVRVPSDDENQILKLAAPPEPSRKPSVQFINALVKGLQMLTTTENC